MRTLRFWIPTLIGATVLPILYFLITLPSGGAAAGHAGAGMGLILVFYPLPLAILMFFGAANNDESLGPLIRGIVYLAAFLQFPLYGFVISYARLRHSLWLKILAGIVWFHIGIVTLVTIIASLQAKL
jgi:hypothetical protein